MGGDYSEQYNTAVVKGDDCIGGGGGGGGGGGLWGGSRLQIIPGNTGNFVRTTRQIK